MNELTYAAPVGKMPYNAYAEIADHPGESTDSKHTGWVDIKQYLHALDQKISDSFAGSGAPTAGESSHGYFWICKETDKTSPKLAVTMLQGKVIDKIVIEFCTQAGDKQTFSQITLENCVVGSIHSVGAANPPGVDGGLAFTKPCEWVGFAYGKITWNYTEMDPETGNTVGNIESHWNRKDNTGG